MIREQPLPFALAGPAHGQTPHNVNGYRVVNQPAVVREASTGLPVGRVIVQYGRPVAPTEATVKRVELFLLVGVLAGSVLALIAGMAIARRAMAPIANTDLHRRRDRPHPRPLAADARAARRRRGRRTDANARGHAP